MPRDDALNVAHHLAPRTLLERNALDDELNAEATQALPRHSGHPPVPRHLADTAEIVVLGAWRDDDVSFVDQACLVVGKDIRQLTLQSNSSISTTVGEKENNSQEGQPLPQTGDRPCHQPTGVPSSSAPFCFSR